MIKVYVGFKINAFDPSLLSSLKMKIEVKKTGSDHCAPLPQIILKDLNKNRN